jgi:hypothetical protein
MEAIQAWAALAGVLVSAVMVLVTLAGFWFVWHQVVLMRQAIGHDSQTTLYHDNFECTRALLEMDGLYPYFRANREFSADFTQGHWLEREGGAPGQGKTTKEWCEERQRYCRALELSELFASHFEHVVLQMATLPRPLQDTWREYMLDVYRQSPVFRQFLAEHAHWYSDALHDVFGSRQR